MEATSEERRESRRREKAADDYAFATKVAMAVVTAGCVWAERPAMEIAACVAIGLGTIGTLRISQLVSIGHDMRERLDSIVVKRQGNSNKAATKQD